MTRARSFPRSAWERYLATLCVALLLVSAARAGDPQINALAPYGIQRGTEATFTINGSGLATVKEFLFYTPGFTVKKIEAEKDDMLKAVIAVSSDCQLGNHALRIRSLGGVSNLRMFTGGNF